MYDIIMVKYGDLTLKGKNQHIFRRNINNQIIHKTRDLNIDYEFQHDLALIILNDVSPDTVIDRLNHISGLSSYALSKTCSYDLDDIEAAALEIIHQEIKEETTFKVETKRANKDIPLKSYEITREIARRVLRQSQFLKVDVHHPKQTLTIEIRNDRTFIYLNKFEGLGGYPSSIGGRGLVLLSGGIDSPVAGYLAMNTGLQIECIHFESTPLTPIESVQKVIDLTKVLAGYAHHSKIKLHLVPFRDIHERLLKDVEEAYLITIMRRMMYRISELIAKANNDQILISGDSIGQVASQTIESLVAVQDAVSSVIIRPLSTYDKNEIIKIARQINTLDISNRAFSDCCTIYVPENPIIKPSVKVVHCIEDRMDVEPLIKAAVQQTKSLMIDANETINIIDQGFTIKDIFDEKD